MSQTPLKTQWPLVLMLWFAGMGAAMQFAKISLSFDLLVQHYQTTDNIVSWLLSATSFLGMLLGAAAGMFLSRWGYKPSLIVAMLLGAILSVAESFLPPLPLFLALRILEGASHLAVVVAAPTLMSAASLLNQRSMVLSLWGTFFGVAYALTTAIAPSIIQHLGVQGLYGIHSIWLVVILSALIIFLPKHLIDKRPVSISLHSIFILHKRIYSNLKTAFPSLVFTCYTTMYVSLLTFFPRMGTTPEWIMVACPLISIGGAFLAGLCVQYFFTPPQMVRLAFIYVALLFVLILIANTQHFELSLLKLALFLGMGLMQGSIYGLIPHLAHDPHEQSHSIAAIAQLGNLGAAIGPPLFAFIWSLWSTMGLLCLGLLITLLGLSLTTLVFKRH